MNQIFAIIYLNFKQALRDKFFLSALFFFVFYLLFAVFLGSISIGHSDKVMRSFGLMGIELSAVLMLAITFSTSFYREKNTRLVEIYLANCSRSIYLSAKILSFMLLSFLYLIFCGLGFSFVLYLSKAFDLAPLLGLFLIGFKLAILVLLASLFCSIFSSQTVALLCSWSLYLAGCLAASAFRITSIYSVQLKTITGIFYTFLPNLDKLDLSYMLAWGRLPDLGYLSMIIQYSLIYMIFLWLLNLLIFQSKEL